MFLKISNNKIDKSDFTLVTKNLHVYINGYIVWNSKLYWGNEFIPFLKIHYEQNSLNKNVPKYNGIFYIIIVDLKINKLQIIIDRYGFLPLMYSETEPNQLLISNT